MPNHLIAILIFGVPSLILIGIVIVLIRRIVRLRRTGQRVTGQCVNVYWEPHPTDRSVIHPRRLWFSTVAFDAPKGGGRYRLKVQTSRHSLGQWVPVLVPPGDPERARVDEFWQLWWAPMLIGLIAAVFVLATAGMISGAVAAAG
ncbi:DUF3592 domain-containing protein [Microlunatus speluncae]|uniref:DUF3592 domain-containing protein n=1 Tax=Microlunatus speluncae TaxID=2594267 RepID=UPI00126631DF|nr:DUF3592 domain-containing protein [Microlunatus speluncae]